MDLFQRKLAWNEKQDPDLHERAKHSNYVKIIRDGIFLIMWEVKTELYYATINNQKKAFWVTTADWRKQRLCCAWNITKLVVSNFFNVLMV